MISNCTGVILAGGLATRFSGQKKALIQVEGKRILDRLYAVYRGLFEEIILVANDPCTYADWDFAVVSDIFDCRSSLTGLHAGLFYLRTPYAFFAACDAPFVRAELIRGLIEAIRPGDDVVIPQTDAGFQPLCAVYSKRCLAPVERLLNKGEFRIRSFFDRVRVHRVPETRLRELDPELLSFLNINTPEDLCLAEEILARQKPLSEENAS